MKVSKDYKDRDQFEYTTDEAREFLRSEQEMRKSTEDYRLAMAARFIIGFIVALAIGMGSVYAHLLLDFLKR